MTSLCISIINYRTEKLTIAAAQSVLTALGGRDAQVVIVDNASGDGSAEAIETWITQQGDPRLQLIWSDRNGGFSAGHNLGMQAVPDAAFYLLLNSDALLREGFFEALLTAAETDPKAGLIAPQLEWDDGKTQISCFRFAGAASELMRGAETGPVSALFRHRDIAIPNPPDLAQVEWVSFACVMLRGEMVRQIGYMDEGYFLYFEDSEYALRARRAGWGVAHSADARAVHFRGGSGPVKAMQTAKKRLPSYYWRSRNRFLRQAHGVFGPLLGNLAWVLGRMVARLRLLTGRRVPPSHEKEWRDLWTGFLTPLKPGPESRQ